MIYGHYDVVSVEPIDDWDSDPFDPVLRGENLYARGASDMKGQIMVCVAAVEALMVGGEFPLKVKFLIEGNEEFGSSHLIEVLTKHNELLECDFCLNTDAGMAGTELPSIIYGLRGSMVCLLHIFGPSSDLHSGQYGGMVHNPIHVLSELIARLHDDNGRIEIPGFYDKVREITEDERLRLASLPYTDEVLLDETGVPTLWGESGYSPYERARVRPSLDVVYFDGGAKKAAVPSKAFAAINIRMVPDQDPEEIKILFSNYLSETLPETVTWNLEIPGGYPPIVVDVNSQWVDALSKALEDVWGVKPVLNRIGAGIPAVTYLKEKLGMNSVLTGFGLPDSNVHGPNEKIHLPTWKRGIEALIRFFYNLGALQEQ
jgi:acetylornithine deacetylase/succinyl-diaminopimelate desuccinylase-like protein